MFEHKSYKRGKVITLTEPYKPLTLKKIVQEILKTYQPAIQQYERALDTYQPAMKQYENMTQARQMMTQSYENVLKLLPLREMVTNNRMASIIEKQQILKEMIIPGIFETVFPRLKWEETINAINQLKKTLANSEQLKAHLQFLTSVVATLIDNALDQDETNDHPEYTQPQYASSDYVNAAAKLTIINHIVEDHVEKSEDQEAKAFWKKTQWVWGILLSAFISWGMGSTPLQKTEFSKGIEKSVTIIQDYEVTLKGQLDDLKDAIFQQHDQNQVRK